MQQRTRLLLAGCALSVLTGCKSREHNSADKYILLSGKDFLVNKIDQELITVCLVDAPESHDGGKPATEHFGPPESFKVSERPLAGNETAWKEAFLKALNQWRVPLSDMRNRDVLANVRFLMPMDGCKAGHNSIADLTIEVNTHEKISQYIEGDKIIRVIGFQSDDHIQMTMLHEVGHAIGLGDAYLLGGIGNKLGQPPSVMSEFPHYFETLQADDLHGVIALFCRDIDPKDLKCKNLPPSRVRPAGSKEEPQYILLGFTGESYRHNYFRVRALSKTKFTTNARSGKKSPVKIYKTLDDSKLIDAFKASHPVSEWTVEVVSEFNSGVKINTLDAKYAPNLKSGQVITAIQDDVNVASLEQLADDLNWLFSPEVTFTVCDETVSEGLDCDNVNVLLSVKPSLKGG